MEEPLEYITLMAGIYIHIPFCKKACHYCNFHFSTTLHQKKALTDAIIREVELQKDYLTGSNIETIYFGGGTPSILETIEIENLLNTISRFHKVDSNAELTLEANPDDLTKEKLIDLKSVGINRLSIGVQSFHEADLEWMNRSHDAQEAHECISAARAIGFDDLSIDLIFGSNTTTTKMWEENLETATQYEIPHLSCYGLTVEQGTALDHYIKTGKLAAPENHLSAEQFEMTIDHLEQQGYEQYEISNYARDKRYSKHNTNYWKQVSYLGLGPSAHSYNGKDRQWNVAHNTKFIESITANKIPAETERLSSNDRVNEYLLTGLRTMWGCEKSNLDKLDSEWKTKIAEDLKELIEGEEVKETDKGYVLTTKGKLRADAIISQLFLTDV